MIETKKSTLPQAKSAGIQLLVWAVLTLPVLWRQIMALGNKGMVPTDVLWPVLSLVSIVGQILLGLALLKGSRGKNVIFGITLMTAAKLIDFLAGFFNQGYCRVEYHYSRYSDSYYTYPFSIWVFLPYLAEVLAYVCLFLFARRMLSGQDEAKQAPVKKLWFLPSVLITAQLPLGILALLFVHVSISILVSGLIGFIRFVISCGVMFMAMLWIAFPEGREDAKYQGDGYKSMIPHLLLCIFTLGIYQLIWISRMTKYLNARIDSEPTMTPWHQVVGCLFVPFYMTYWVYKTAQRLDVVAREQGVQSNLTMPCTVLKLVSPANIILPSILIQDKVNVLALLAFGKVLPNAPCVQNGPTWGGAPAQEAPAADPQILNPDQLPEL